LPQTAIDAEHIVACWNPIPAQAPLKRAIGAS
jgi:hypothetical protein